MNNDQVIIGHSKLTKSEPIPIIKNTKDYIIAGYLRDESAYSQYASQLFPYSPGTMASTTPPRGPGEDICHVREKN